MIAFGCAITDLALYERCAEPGIRLAAESDSAVLAFEGMDTLFQSYNLLLDKAAGYTDLEALVLVHQDAEIIDPEFCAKTRRALGDPDVAIVGCAGAVGVRSIAWWEGSVTWASFTHRYQELGGGEFPAFAWEPDQLPSHARTGEVDSIDGFAMALSPWAVRELRFDESLGRLHGYDFDLCLQARAVGKKIHTEDFRVIHHHSLELISDPDLWVEAHIRLAEKWEGQLPSTGPDGGDWRRRALRAEAEASAAKGRARASELQYEALDRAVRKSWSWRLTAPLRVAGGSRLERRLQERKRARGQARR